MTTKEWLLFVFPHQQIGSKEAKANRWNQCWWFDAYDNAAKNIGSKSKSEDNDTDNVFPEEKKDGSKVYTGLCF